MGTEGQIIAVLWQVEAGARAAELCCKAGISQVTYSLWKRQYSEGRVSELRELRLFREHYDHRRPHSSMGDRTPAAFAGQMAARREP